MADLVVLEDGQVLEKNLTTPEVAGEWGSHVQSFMQWIADTKNDLPAWWTRHRDVELRRCVKENSFLSMVLNIVQLKLYGTTFSVRPKDSSIQQQHKIAEIYDGLWKQFWNDSGQQFIEDILSQDNGGWIFVEGKDRPNQILTGPATGLFWMDSRHTRRIGNGNIPIEFDDKAKHKVHKSRLINLTEMPSAATEMRGVGYCFISRALILAQHLEDVALFEAEALGSRESQEMIYATGARSKDLKDAFEEAMIDSSNEGRRRTARRVYLGLRSERAKVGKFGLKNLPDGFNKANDFETTLMMVALASGLSADEFMVMAKSGMTKASLTATERKSQSRLMQWFKNKLIHQVGQKFLPEFLELVPDDEVQRMDDTSARIRSQISRSDDTDIQSGVLDIRSARWKRLRSHMLTPAEFEGLELADGRLPNGTDISALFSLTTGKLSDMLTLPSFPDPLDFDGNDSVQIQIEIDVRLRELENITLTARTNQRIKDAMLAVAALKWLKSEYQEAAAEIGPTDEQLDSLIGEEQAPTTEEGFLTQQKLRAEVKEVKLGKKGLSEFLLSFGEEETAAKLAMSEALKARLASNARLGDLFSVVDRWSARRDRLIDTGR